MKLLRFISTYTAKHVSSIIGAAFAFVVAAILFFNLFPFNVAEFKKIDVKGDTSVGGVVEYTNNYCQNVQKGTDRTLDRYLIAKDPKLVNPIQLSSSPENETQVGAGCRMSAPIKLPINSNVPEGDYKLRVKACYEVFLRFKCVQVQGDSDYFHVSKSNIEQQVSDINQKIDEVNAQLKANGSNAVVNTLMIPTPQTVDVPFQTQSPAPQTPSTPTPSTPTEPQQACVIDLLGIRLLCN